MNPTRHSNTPAILRSGSGLLRSPSLILLSLLSLAQGAFATTRITNGSASDVQAKINAAATGDIVTIPVGTFTWNTVVSIPGSVGIILQGSGVASTTVIRGSVGSTNEILHISTSSNTSSNTRVTGIGFVDNHLTDETGGCFIKVGGDAANAKLRIDHCNFTSTPDLSAGALSPQTHLLFHILWDDSQFGLIDHCAFATGQNSEIIHNSGRALGSASPDWNNDVTPGSDQALYIEDCTFFNNALYHSGGTFYFLGNSSVQNYYGARLVFRHNTLTMTHVDVHGTPGNVGARWYEIYDNTFIVVANGNQSDAVGLRAGSGVVFNNKQTVGSNGQGGSIKLQEEDSGSYPQLYQIGRGKAQALDPLYIWNNDQAVNVDTPSLIQANRDFYLSTTAAGAKPGYTPYTYPHPMSVTTLPNSPSSLQASPN